MSLIGPSTMPQGALDLVPKVVSAQAIGSPDIDLTTVFAAGRCRRVIPQAAGTVYLKHSGDAGFTPYAVLASIPIDGDFIAIGGTGTGSSAITVNCEL
jgi:hypothetical protein